jgi:hypothetical protein
MAFGISFGSSKSKSNTNANGQSDPWGPTMPYLQDFLKEMGAVGGTGLTPDQKASLEYLKGNAFQGNPWDVQQAGLANQLYSAEDRTGIVGDAYSNLQSQLGDYASGKYLDPMSNPQMQAMLQQVGDDAANRVNAQFAGAGRDLSGANQMAVGRGVTQAQLPLLMDQYNRAQQQQFDAAKTLYGAGQSTATTQGGLDAQRFGFMGQGAAAGQQALDMQNQGANDIFNLDQTAKMTPYEDLAMVGSLLFPAAGLGGQKQEQSTTKGKSSSIGAGFSISDERVKEGIEEIGEMADGQKMYRWRYKNDPSGEIHVGPMAQEVEGEHPEAVAEDESGIKHVNLDAATRRAADVVRQRMAKRKG